MRNHVLLQFKDFRKLFYARLISSIGEKFYTIALAWYILSTDSESGKTQLGFLMALTLLPIVFFGPFIGTLTDRFDKKKCMLISDAIRAILIGTMAYLLYNHQLNIVHIYIISFLQAMCVPLFDTATQSSISLLTDPTKTSQAVAINASVTQISAVLGALLGSILIHYIGIEGAFLFNACSYLFSMLFVYQIKKPLKSLIQKAPFIQQFKDGFAFLASKKAIYSLLLLFGLLNLFIAPILLLLPILVKSDLGLQANTLALFEAFLALGSLITTIYLSFNMVKTKVYLKLFLASALLGVNYLVIANYHHSYQIIASLFLIGIMLSFTNSIAMSLFHQEVPNEMKGRFFAVLYTIVFAVIPLSYSAIGFISKTMSTYQIFAWCGSTILIISLLLLFIPKIKLAQ